MREVVHVETQEQYDYVNEKLNYMWFVPNWKDERENTCLRTDEKSFGSLEYYKSRGDVKIISFNEFKSRCELKIGDTFEYNGFVCRVESEVEKWVYNETTEAYYKIKTNNHSINLKEITDQEFINQLEKYTEIKKSNE